MKPATSFEQDLARVRGALSPSLRRTAEYMAAHPVDIATRSLRSVARKSGLSPASFSRLARELGHESYESLREQARQAVQRNLSSFSRKVEILQAEERAGGTPPFLTRQAEACIANIRSLASGIELADLKRLVERLHKARQVMITGELGSAGAAEYMAYVGSYFCKGWRLVSGPGSALGETLADLGPRDVLIVITMPPTARRALRIARMASEQGAHVVVITDRPTCRVLEHADTSFVVPSDSPQFFSSYAATIVLVETILGMLVARRGKAAAQRIAAVESRNRALHET